MSRKCPVSGPVSECLPQEHWEEGGGEQERKEKMAPTDHQMTPKGAQMGFQEALKSRRIKQAIVIYLKGTHR